MSRVVALMLLAHAYGVAQLFVLGSGWRTVRWWVVAAAFSAGVFGCTVLTIAVQLGWIRLAAAATGQSVDAVTTFGGYTFDPFAEELLKLLPLAAVFVIPRLRAQLGVTDAVLLAAAIGSGFGLTELVLHLSDDAANALFATDRGRWVLPIGLATPEIPGVRAILASWVPNGMTAADFLAFEPVPLKSNMHLAWSAVAGLGAGLGLRARRSGKRLALALVLFAGFAHAAHNLLLTGPEWLATLLTPLELLGWLRPWFPLAALLLAAWLDRRDIADALRAEPEVCFEIERLAQRRPLALWRAVPRLAGDWRGLRRLWHFVQLRRAFAYERAVTPASPALDTLRLRLAATRVALERRDPDPARGAGSARRQRRSWLEHAVTAALALPAFLYLGLGTFPAGAVLQDVMSSPVVYPILVALLVGGVALLVVRLVSEVKLLPRLLRRSATHRALAGTLRLTAATGTLLLGVVTLASVVAGRGPLDAPLGGGHVIEGFFAAVWNMVVVVTLFGIGLQSPALARTTWPRAIEYMDERNIGIYEVFAEESAPTDPPTQEDLAARPDYPFRDGHTPSASELEAWAQRQGWTKVEKPGAPIIYRDQNGNTRLKIKHGTARTPGSEQPHAEVFDETGGRIDPRTGERTGKKQPGNHPPIIWDLPALPVP